MVWISRMRKIIAEIRQSRFLNSDGFTIALLCGMAFIIRFYTLFTCDNFLGSTPAGRLLGAFNVIQSPSPFDYYQVVFDIIHPYLLAGTIYVTGGSLFASRMLSVCCGVVLILPFYHWIKCSTDSSRLAFFSSIVVCVYPLHILYSTITMAEAPFLLFLITSFCLFAHYKKHRAYDRWFLSGASIFLGLAILTRYEGLMFIPLLGIFLIRERWQEKVLYLFLVSVAPFFLLILNNFHFNDPLYFLNVSDAYSNVEILYHKAEKIGIWYYYESIGSKIMTWVSILTKTMSLPFVVCGVAGMVYCLVKRRYLFLASAFLLTLSVMTYKVFNESLLVNLRYSLTLGILCIPLTIVTLDKIITVFFKRVSFYLLSVLVLVYAAVSLVTVRYDVFKLPEYVHQVSAWLAHQSSAKSIVILDKDPTQVYYTTIPLLSALPLDRIKLAPQKIINKKRTLDTELFLAYLRSLPVSHVIIHREGYLLSEIVPAEFNNSVFIWYEYVFTKTCSYGPYSIFSVERQLKDTSPVVPKKDIVTDHERKEKRGVK